MLSLSSLSSIAIITYIFCGAALSIRLPVDEVFRKVDKRLLCVEDPILLSFQFYPEVSDPFCYDYLGIPSLTSTVSLTSRTSACPIPFLWHLIDWKHSSLTTTTTVTTSVTVDVITVPTGTATITITAGPVQKRQYIPPASEITESCKQSPQNQTLISDASSACSCLTLAPSVVTQTATLTSVRNPLSILR